ncbi:hypothetical protein BVC80_9061g74 [Macleaya cordata]|uniref:Uncharacterized protein n=1 Tax=Macleaya cordata TaxID=56857 RepID=A0A200PN63_MACCD|nr:hypothetical protein BVC80_9061g74 [Macleaya cordata]
MEGVIDADVPLDYAAFQFLPTQNRYEAFVCHDRKIEIVASGLLEQLMLELPEVKNFHPEEEGDSFKLQLPENLRGSAWFTKSTLARFLHIVGAPESLEICKTIRDEMSQLEEARRFHLELYAQGHQEYPGTGETDGYNTKDGEQTLKLDSQTMSSDATKNELLRAMDLRLTALREDLAASFAQAAGFTCSTKQIADLVAFCEHFGAMDLRNSLSKYLALGEKDQVAEPQSEQSKFSPDSRNDSGKMTNLGAQECSPVNTFKAIKYGASPAKAAQVERQSSTGSEESSNSSDEDQSFSERSRPLVRSASSRRSASPMRRIQIGRSGSRRAAALTIKSLNYFPARERLSSNRDGAGNSSEDEDSVQPPKKPESNVRRMSVQDAISLFESKQRDQTTDLQKKKSADVSVSTNKAVLRRWSSGMGDSSTQCPSENASEGAVQITTDNLVTGEMQKNSAEVKPDHDFIGESLNPNKTAETGALVAKGERKTSRPTDRRVDILVVHAEEDDERVTDSAEWSQKKEAELSQMLKMMENKPVRYRNMTTASRSQEFPSEKRGGFYDHYKQKRDEKLRGENLGKRAEKEEQFKALQDILDQRKAEMTSKVAGIAGKQNTLGKPRKSQKNPSPPMLPKKETLKPAVSRKASPKASPKPSPLPATRKSWPSAPSPKTSGPTPTKTPNGISSAGTTPTRRKSQPTPSPTRTNPKLERSQQQQKSTKATQIETKRSLKGQEEKKQQATTRSDKISKTKALPAAGDGSELVPTKPSFYNKVTRKGSVVPLESKPFLRKGSGIGPGVGPGVVKTKASQSDESLRNSGNLNKAQEEVVADTPKPVTQQQEEDVVPPVSDVTDLEPEASVHCHQNCEQTENCDQFVAEGDSCKKTTEFPVEMQSDEVSTISPNAWVEIEEHPELPVSCDNDINPTQIANPTNVVSVTSSSPRVRHSLSQMLQEDNGDPEIIEWGNAENPPAMVYQKDAPKGLKRLLKFARKSKGEANVTGWSSPSVFSEGEEDAEESKAASKRNSDALLRKAALQASFGDSYNVGNSDKRAMDNTTTIHDLLSAQSNISKISAQSSHKLSEGNISAAATSTKATRSFFSLSTFRSSKSNETKLR